MIVDIKKIKRQESVKKSDTPKKEIETDIANN